MSERTFQFNDEKPGKFWSIKLAGVSHTVHFGRIGSKGRTKTKDFESTEAASKDCEKLIAQKVEKGYVEGVSRAIGVAGIHLVNDKIQPVSKRDVDRLEKAIGSLPVGYRGFMSHCGSVGELCEFLEVWSPKKILDAAESERQAMTELLVELEYKLRPLTRSDLDSLWVIGRGNMSTLIYSPLHEGELFNVAHRGAENEGRLIHHKYALEDPAALYWWGTARHPFPFFVAATKKENGRKSFSYRSRKMTYEIAEDIVQYWGNGNGSSPRVRMPSRSHPDGVYVFVKCIGGYIKVNRNKRIGRKGAYGEVIFDKEFRREVNGFVKEFAKS